MSDWTADIPCRDKGEPLNLLSILEVCRELDDPTERNVASYLLEYASNELGANTFGDVLSILGQASPEACRQLLDRARAENGLESTCEVDSQRDLAAARRDDPPPPPSLQVGPPRDPQGFASMGCAAEGCRTFPVDELGKPVPVRVRKWWCPEHRHLAAPGDLDPWQGPGLRYGPGGGIELALTEEDERFYEQIDREREAEDAERERGREAQAEAKAAAHQKWREQHIRRKNRGPLGASKVSAEATDTARNHDLAPTGGS
jgi:hypothetical protein